jgi:cytochrome c-type biogenesis protein CcmH/NrfG
MLGRLEDAGTILAQLVAESPDSWSTWEAVGIWQQRRGEEQESWKAFLRAAQLAPDNSSVVSHLAAAGLGPQRSLDLGRVLEAYLELEPLNLGFRACLVNCYLNNGEIERARDQAQRIVSFAPFSVIPPEVVSAMNELLRQLQPVDQH